jgi:HD-GYP domain-containing protein (c-di-GMP phosphodiesterase class II)
MGTGGIPVEHLAPGTILAESVYTEDGRLLLIKQGITLSREIIDGLKKRGITKVSTGRAARAEEGKPDAPGGDAGASPPFSCPKSLEKRLFITYNGRKILKLDDPSIQKTKKKAIESSHKLLQGISSSGKIDRDELFGTARGLLNAIAQNQDAFLNIAGIRAVDEYTFEHCVGVAAYTTIIAKAHGLSGDALHAICSGSLLHDAGKMLVDPAILNKPGKLTDEEFDVMKTHTTKGYEVLMENNISKDLAAIALGHHERCDGKGYPKGLQTEGIPLSSRMAAIADVYDALTSDRVYRKAMDLYKAMAIMLSGVGRQFDQGLIGLFQRIVGVYPIGSLVRLSDGCTARVIQQNDGVVRPVIQLLRDGGDRELEDKKIVDLMSRDDLYITEAVMEKEAA